MGKSLTGEINKGIKGPRKGKKLLATCAHCKCQRYTPCGCEGAAKLDRDRRAIRDGQENAA